MSWLAGGLQHSESGSAGIGPERRKVSMEKSGSGLPRQSTQPLDLTDNYMSWLAEGLQHPESGNAGIGPDIRKVSTENSGSGFP
jgi:hypothetical protein